MLAKVCLSGFLFGSLSALLYSLSGGILSLAVMLLIRRRPRVGALAIAPTAAAIWLGGLLTRRVKQATFLKIIYIVLIVSGVVLFITNVGKP